MHARWRKSSHSDAHADCVEIAYSTEVHVRDSKQPDAGRLTVPIASWHPDRLARITR